MSPPARAAQKTYLDVPFSAKERAKSAGAKWDPMARKWFVPQGVPLADFHEWLAPDEFRDLSSPQDSDKDRGHALNGNIEKGVSLSGFLETVSRAILSHVPRSQWVRAEISQFRTLSSGHVAIELVEHTQAGDLSARLPSFIWNGRAKPLLDKFRQATGAELTAGLKVLVQVSADVHASYGPRGMVEDIDPAFTLGDIEAKLKALREALTREGVFHLNRSLAAPTEFCRVAVVSPPDAAGLGDFRRDADRLHQAGVCHFDYYTAQFQGQNAAPSLVEG